MIYTYTYFKYFPSISNTYWRTSSHTISTVSAKNLFLIKHQAFFDYTYQYIPYIFLIHRTIANKQKKKSHWMKRNAWYGIVNLETIQQKFDGKVLVLKCKIVQYESKMLELNCVCVCMWEGENISANQPNRHHTPTHKKQHSGADYRLILGTLSSSLVHHLRESKWLFERKLVVLFFCCSEFMLRYDCWCCFCCCVFIVHVLLGRNDSPTFKLLLFFTLSVVTLK